MEDGAVEIGRGHPAVPRGAERPLGEADGLRALLVGEQRERPQVVDGGARRPDVAAGGVPAAGERVEQRERPHGLGRVGVLLEAGPVEVGHRPPLPQQPRGLDDLRGRDPGDRLDALRRVAAAERGVGFERGHAGDRAAAPRAGHRAGERGLDDALHESPGGRVVRRPAAPRRGPTPRDGRGAPSGERSEAASSRPVSSRTSSGPLVQSRTKSRSYQPSASITRGQPEGERAVGAGAHAQPLVGAGGRARAPRIDHDQRGAARDGLRDRGGLGEVGGRRVVAPQEQA